MRLGNKNRGADEAPDDRPAAPVNPAAEAPSAPGTELALVPALQTIIPSEFFKPKGSEAVIAALEIEVRKQAADLDISTEAGRKAIASLAYKVSRTKTGLDSARKDLVADKKAEVKAIDEEGSRIWERIEALQAEVRQPLTDWENGNNVRVAGHEGTIVTLQAYVAWASDNWQTAAIADIEANLKEVREFERDWQEFVKRGKQARDLAQIALAEALDRRRTRDAEQEELKRLRAEKAQREERERIEAAAEEARLAERRKNEEQAAEQARLAEAERQRVEAERNEAAAKAVQAEAERVEAEHRAAAELERVNAEAAAAADRAAEAERQAQLERVRIEREAKETEERLERQLQAEREQAEQRRLEAQRAAEEQAERARLALIEAEQRSAREAQAAAEQAERDREAAIVAERERVAEEQEAERAAQALRESNKAHRRKIDKAAADQISAILNAAAGAPVSDLPAILVDSIAKGLVPHVTINY